MLVLRIVPLFRTATLALPLVLSRHLYSADVVSSHTRTQETRHLRRDQHLDNERPRKVGRSKGEGTSRECCWSMKTGCFLNLWTKLLSGPEYHGLERGCIDLGSTRDSAPAKNAKLVAQSPVNLVMIYATIVNATSCCSGSIPQRYQGIHRRPRHPRTTVHNQERFSR